MVLRMRMETVCGGACEDDEDKNDDMEDDGGAAHAHGHCVGVPVKKTRTWRTRVVLP